jgi:uncharacterized RDD family membrane protein YckC
VTSAADDEGRSRLAAAAGRLAFYPARVAARASREQLEAAADDVLVPELARLIDGAFASTLPEEVARSLVRHRVLERVVEELAASGALDEAVEQALKSERTNELTNRIVQSEAMRQAIREVVAGPEVRAAITKQTTGLAEELVVGVRKGAVRLDDRAERAVHRAPRAPRAPFAGIATRAAALGIDASVIIVSFASLAALVGVIASLVGGLRPEWLAGILLGSGWILFVGGYLVLFWSGAGQTPGMRLLHLRVRGRNGRPPSVGRAVVRAFGTLVAIVPFFAGYVPVLFDERRRGLPDFLAGTEVVYDDTSGRPRAEA